MKQKVRITDHDGNRATMQRLLQRREKELLIEHSGCRFAMTNYRHCEERGTNDEAISTTYQRWQLRRDCFSGLKKHC